MSSLVLELQRDSLDKTVGIAELLRKALVVATKLDLMEFAVWVKAELEGYHGSDIPEYRLVRGNVQAWNPYIGWIPVIPPDENWAAELSKVWMAQPAAEIEKLAQSQELLEANLPPALEHDIMRGMDIPLRPVRRLSPSSLLSVVEIIRTRVLDWSLRLEKEGIVGEGLTFSDQEKHKAVLSQHITNFHIGHMSQSQIQSASHGTTQTLTATNLSVADIRKFIDLVRANMDALGIAQHEKDQLQADLAAIEPQLTAPQPNHGILREGLRSMRTILEGAGGNLIAAGILHQMANLFASL